MFAMIRRCFSFSGPEPPPHLRPISHRLDSICSTQHSRPAIARPTISRASPLRQSADDSAPRGQDPATDNQAAGWLEMRRTAGWQVLESKPPGRHLLQDKSSDGEEASQLDRLRNACARRIADRGSEIVEAPFSAPVPGLDSPDGDTHKSLDELSENEGASAADREGRRDATAPTLRQFAAPPSLVVDRRTARRYSASQVHRRLLIAEGFCNSPAMLSDISTNGIRLVLRVQYRLSASLQLTIISKSYGITGPIQAKVVRLIALTDGQWLTCCVFDKPLDHEWLKTLIRIG
jgi:hypothetical protein